MNEMTKKVNFLNKEYMKKKREFEEKLNRYYLKELEQIKRTHRRCPVERNNYTKRYNPKTGRITEVKHGKKCGCGEYTPKKDWITVSVEDIELDTVGIFGGDDQLAYVRRRDYYKVCPNCHKMVWDRFEKISRSETFLLEKYEEDAEQVKKSFIPEGWKKIVKVEKN